MCAHCKKIHMCFQDGSLPFARSIKDIYSEFRLLSKLTELIMNQGEQEEALQYATLAVEIAGKTGKRLWGNLCCMTTIKIITAAMPAASLVFFLRIADE